VNSPVRAFRAVGGNPLFIHRARGAYLYDIDGNSYIDYVLSWGPMIAGHAHPKVVTAIKEAAEWGTSFGAPTLREMDLAEMVMGLYPSMEKIRMVNSGTEATMSAIRLARGFTGRDKIIKFEGCYHGHADGLLVKAGSGLATFGVPDSPGVPKDYAKNTITLPFNDRAALKQAIEANARDLAAVIIEPVVGNSGCVLPSMAFLKDLRTLTKKHDVVLIFDEVMTGFRVSLGGAQERYQIKPDLTCLGKVIGGGLPVGAYGGRADIMSQVSPEGPVYQAGTLSGNPLAMAAGIATIKIISRKGAFERCEARAAELEEALADAAKRAGASVKFYRAGTMFCTYFTDKEVVDFETAKQADTEKFARFFIAMLKRGIYMAPSQFEAGFMSLAHSSADVEATAEAAYESFREVC
jgi:glutamate-1-semialdehyde 2,1-aminomutase